MPNICIAEISQTAEIAQNRLKRGNSADIPYISKIPTTWNFDQSPVKSKGLTMKKPFLQWRDMNLLLNEITARTN